MRDDIRDRFFTPFVLPLTVIGVMLLVGVSLSRVLLAVSELGAALVAVLAAGYIMAIAFFVEARRRIPARTLGVALALGLIALMGAGAVANAAGMRSLEEPGVEGEVAGREGEAGETGGGTEPLWIAIDIEYQQAPEALPPGDITVTLENEGTIEHNVVFEELGDQLVVEAPGGESATGNVTLEAGEYTYYCSVPGHRTTMEGTLVVEEGAAGASGGAGAASEGASDGAAGGASESGSEATSEPASAAGGSASESEG
jgi:plastocyanin